MVDSPTKERFESRGDERIVLACVLQNPDLLVEADHKLSENDFLSEHHRALYSLLKKLDAQGVKSFDLVVVITEAAKFGMEELIGGVDYLNALMSTIVDKANFEVYLNRVVDASTKYKLYLESIHIKDMVMENANQSEGNLDSMALLGKAEARILTIALESSRIEDAQDIGAGLSERLEKLAANPVDVVGYKTGIHLLDKAINGLTPGSLTIVAARPKNGKSTLLMNIAANLTYFYENRIPILYIDTEMSREEVQTRLISHLSRVPERLITTGKFSSDPTGRQQEAVYKATQIVSSGLYLHKYYPGFTIDGLKTLVRKYKAKEGIGALFFDYIKLSESANLNAAKEHQQLGFLTTSLKDLAGSLNIPVISAAQLRRRESGAKERTRHTDEDVGDTDRILRYCNNLLAISRKSKQEVEQDGIDCGTHRLQVLASRAGFPMYNGIDLVCDFPTLTFNQASMQANGTGSLTANGGGF